jgi:N-acetylglucosamine-6-phosphate deacetylase
VAKYIQAAGLGPSGYREDYLFSVQAHQLEGLPEFVSIAPAMVDPHIHGAFGVDFVTAAAEQISEALDRLAESGVEWVLPTSVSMPADACLEFLERIPQHSIVAGIHLEGPFLSPEFPGAQPAEALEVPNLDDPTWRKVFDHPRLRAMTLAPELEGAVELTRYLSQRDVVVGLGHTGASADQMAAAFAAGAKFATHLFNAMKPFHHRHSGPVGFSLLRDGFCVEIIHDFQHVSEDAIELMLAMKGWDEVIAISDGTFASGLKESAVETRKMWGQEVTLQDGQLRLVSNGALAGSCTLIGEVFRSFALSKGLSAASWFCSHNPRRLHRLPQPQKFMLLDPETQELLAQINF